MPPIHRSNDSKPTLLLHWEQLRYREQIYKANSTFSNIKHKRQQKYFWVNEVECYPYENSTLHRGKSGIQVCRQSPDRRTHLCTLPFQDQAFIPQSLLHYQFKEAQSTCSYSSILIKKKLGNWGDTWNTSDLALVHSEQSKIC